MVIASVGAAQSEAGLFRRAYYGGPVTYQAVAPAAAPVAAPVARAPAAQPLIQPAATQIVVPADAPAVAPVGTYCPCRSVAPSGGWSTAPHSSWDFGKFPPYFH
jgi:hypothetical protein